VLDAAPGALTEQLLLVLALSPSPSSEGSPPLLF
jgi:hypothetical protein